MPWKSSDASGKTRKAKTPKSMRMWKDIANNVLAKTGDEGRAIATANGVIKKRSKAKSRRT